MVAHHALYMVYSGCKDKMSDLRGDETKSARTLTLQCL